MVLHEFEFIENLPPAEAGKEHTGRSKCTIFLDEAHRLRAAKVKLTRRILLDAAMEYVTENSEGLELPLNPAQILIFNLVVRMRSGHRALSPEWEANYDRLIARPLDVLRNLFHGRIDNSTIFNLDETILILDLDNCRALGVSAKVQ